MRRDTVWFMGASLVALAGGVVATPTAAAGDIGFVEDFALAADRPAALKQLIPGTDDYYYYHCLHALNSGQFDKVGPLATQWYERHRQTARLTEIQTRHALLAYDKNPQQTLEYVRNRLGLRFDHQKEVLGEIPDLPAALDQKLIARETLKASSLARWGNLDNFEDGAFDWLWAASLAPMLAAGEMGGRLETLAARVRDDTAPGGLGQRYRAVFGAPGADEAVVVDLAKAMAAWLTTLVSPRSPFDHFRDALLNGDKESAARFPVDAQRGLRLFIGKANCAVCHAGPRFSNGEFADIGVPFFVPGGVDSGRHGGLQRLLASRYNRLGEFSDALPGDASATGTRHVLQAHRHFGEFRVPTLRGLLSTAPYMHDGSLTTLEAVVQHYSALNEERLHADGERILRRLDLSAGEAADLAAFLRSLSAGPVPSTMAQ